jgi:hypothetical protein
MIPAAKTVTTVKDSTKALNQLPKFGPLSRIPTTIAANSGVFTAISPFALPQSTRVDACRY